jgi:hypothetical protein
LAKCSPRRASLPCRAVLARSVSRASVPAWKSLPASATFVLTPREFTISTGGLFLFIPDLVRLECDTWAQAAKLLDSRMVPSARALRASLALKLWSIERKSHVMESVADEGLARRPTRSSPSSLFWRREHGKVPQHLVFDSKLTAYSGRDRLYAEGMTFITWRRRSPKLLTEVTGDRQP